MQNEFYDAAFAKIVPRPDTLRARIARESPTARIVVMKGVYDLFHAGHYRSFVNAKRAGEQLVVAVASDASVRLRKGPGRPIVTSDDRMLLIAGLSCVDWVTSYDDTSPFDMLKLLCPNAFAASHFDSLSEEQKSILELAIELRYVPKVGETSTTALIQKICKTYEKA